MTMMSQDEITTEWCKALRSGDIEQGQTFFNCKNKLCAIGVLLEILPISRKVVGDLVHYGPNENSAVLPERLLKNIGFNFGSIIKIMHSNDNLRLSFSEIADIIEDLHLEHKLFSLKENH